MQIFVIGMHRSGTSTITRIINLMNIYFGPEGISSGANNENVKGFWERKDVRQLNDYILEENYFDWYKISKFNGISSFNEESLAEFGKRASRLILDIDAFRPWVIKEPRLCLTFSLWKKYLERPIVIYVYRNPIEVSLSLQERNSFPIEYGLNLWEKYNAIALEQIKGLPVHYISYNELMQNPNQVVTNLQNFLIGESVPIRKIDMQELSKFIDPTHYRQKADDNYTVLLSEKQYELYKSIGANTNPQIDFKKINSILEKFETVFEKSINYKKLNDLNTKLITHNKSLETKLISLNKSLEQTNGNLNTQNKDNKDEIKKLKKRIVKLQQTNTELGSKVNDKQDEVRDERISKLELKNELNLSKEVILKIKNDVRNSNIKTQKLEYERTKAYDEITNLKKLITNKDQTIVQYWNRIQDMRLSNRLKAVLGLYKKKDDDVVQLDFKKKTDVDLIRKNQIKNPKKGEIVIDVIVPICDTLVKVQPCILALLEKTNYTNFNLIVLDPSSNREVSQFLDDISDCFCNVTIINVDSSIDFSNMINTGLQNSVGDYIVILTSNSIVPSKWITRILELPRQTRTCDVYGFLSNTILHREDLQLNENQINNEFKEGVIDQQNRLIEKNSLNIYPEISGIRGLNFVIQRKALNRIIEFYKVTNSHKQKPNKGFYNIANEVGLKYRLMDNLYIPQNRILKPKDNKKKKSTIEILDQKHSSSDLKKVINHSISALKNVSHSNESFSILFYLPVKGGSGGSHSVVQETVGLRRCGVNARIANLSRNRSKVEHEYSDLIAKNEDLFIFFDNEKSIETYLKYKSYDFFIATIYHSMFLVDRVVRTNKNIRSAYYVQDYEPWFFDEGDPKREKALKSYDLDPSTILFAKTDWLCDTVRKYHNVHVHKVIPSLDTDTYYNVAKKLNSEIVRIVAMIRPQTPRRGANRTMRVLAELEAAHSGKIEIEVFGCESVEFEKFTLRTDFQFKNKGILTRIQVADLLRNADIFIDLSDYQAFGRTGLEAMACGCAVVLPKNGGANEYALNGVNSFLLDTFDEALVLKKLRELILNPTLLQNFKDEGLKKAKEYSIAKSSYSEYELFKNSLQDNLRVLKENKPINLELSDFKNKSWLINRLKFLMLEMGFTNRPYLDLSKISTDDSDPSAQKSAAWQLALWHSNKYQKSDAIQCLKFLSIVNREVIDPTWKEQAIILEAECHDIIGNREKGKDLLNTAISKRPSANLFLAASNLEVSIADRISKINEGLALVNTPAISCKNNGISPYDSLRSEFPKGEISRDKSPKVTVIVPVYNASSTIRTAIDSILDQTWENLEIFVVDDCSTDSTIKIVEEYEKLDSRLKLIKSSINQGPYVARNNALKLATGEFVTCNDADDWSHPEKIEIQARQLMASSQVVANASKWVRATADLKFFRRGNPGYYIQLNVSSTMFRRELVLKKLGYWDSVRFGADTEWVYRLKRVFGKDAFYEIPNKLLSIARSSSSSLTENEKFGYPGYPMGARKEYKESYLHHFESESELKYEFPQNIRPFPVPQIMEPIKEKNISFDVIVVTDFRNPSIVGYITTELQNLMKSNIRIGLVQIARYEPELPLNIDPRIRDFLKNESVKMLVYGDTVDTKLLAIFDPFILLEEQKYIPEVKTDRVAVVADQPSSKYWNDISNRGFENLKNYFGDSIVVYPLNESVRMAISSYKMETLSAKLSETNWVSLIEITTSHDSPKHSEMGKIKLKESEEVVELIDVKDVSSINYVDKKGVVVIMPCIDIDKGLKTAKILERRAGMKCKIYIVHDTKRQGFIKTLNETASRIKAMYLIYLAQDAFPGTNWMLTAYEIMEKRKIHLLGFNDGKWRGRIASFGMVRQVWAQRLYDGNVLFPSYKSHKADNEITLIARALGVYFYAPDCTLVEYDPDKDFGGSNPIDDALFNKRFLNSFDGLVQWSAIKKMAKEYKIKLEN